jgi:F-type H+-transporting ATPase subunit b
MTDLKCLLRLGLVVLVATVVVGLTPASLLAQEHDEPAQEQEHAAAEADGHAAAADEHAEEEHHVAVPTPRQYVYKWINFFLLAGLLYWLLVTPPAFVQENFEFAGLNVILSERNKAIVAASALAKQQTAQAAEGLEASAGRLERVEEEAAQLVAQAREDAERDKARLIDEAASQAEAIRAGASRDMNSEVARAQRDLQSHIAHLAVGIATDLVKKNFSGDDQDRLVRQYLDRLGESVS